MMESQLSKLHWDLLEHVRRYRIGVPRFCWAAVRREHDGISKGDVREALRCLWGVHGYLEFVSLFGKQKFHRLTKRFFDDFEVEPDMDVESPLTEEVKLSAYAMLGFCFGRGAQRSKLTRDELRQLFPELAESVSQMGDPARLERYYLAGERLGYLRVDKGGHGRWDRIASYIDRDIGRHECESGFRRLIADGYFEVTVVTATPHKARRLRQLLAERHVHQTVDVDCYVLPELLHFLAPPPQARAHHIPRRGF